jgi:enterochelin esterase family protein
MVMARLSGQRHELKYSLEPTLMRLSLLAIAAMGLLPMHLLGQDIPLSKILIEKEPWREAGTKLPAVTYLEADPSGKIIVYQGTPAVVLSVGGKTEKVPPGFTMGRQQNAVNTSGGGFYIIDDKSKTVSAAVGGKQRQLELDGLTAPVCLTVWPDEGHLVVGEADGAWLWAVRIEADGSLGPGDRYYSLRTRPGERMRVTAMTMDAAGLLYACTPLGIQVFDPTGRLSGVVAAPAKDTMTAITIGGANGDTLFVACGDKVHSRRIQGKALFTVKKS